MVSPQFLYMLFSGHEVSTVFRLGEILYSIDNICYTMRLSRRLRAPQPAPAPLLFLRRGDRLLLSERQVLRPGGREVPLGRRDIRAGRHGDADKRARPLRLLRGQPGHEDRSDGKASLVGEPINRDRHRCRTGCRYRRHGWFSRGWGGSGFGGGVHRGNDYCNDRRGGHGRCGGHNTELCYSRGDLRRKRRIHFRRTKY